VIGVYAVAAAVMGNYLAAQELARTQPGGYVRVSHPNAIQPLPQHQPSGDCEGCGAPLKAYIHHCEYCRRSK
jgi:hypothetical protein